VLKLEGVRCRAGGFELGPVDVDLSGARVWLVTGRMGSGKTTLLRVLGGALPLAGGRVIAPEGWTRAYLPQFPEAVLGGRHLAEDLLGSPRPRSADRARAREVLRRLRVDPAALRRPGGALSAGERRRAALALLVLAGADLWAVDEPEAGLDAEAMAAVRGTLEDAPARILFVATHRFEVYAPFRPHVIVLEGGRVAASGPLGAVLRDPKVAPALNLFNRPGWRLWRELGKYRSDLPGNVWETSRNEPPMISQVQALLTDSATNA